ncbi:MAG: 3-deoxy-manno-octulosonate cytidylyltransferase [Bacteroidota bacterium]|jgi:3-deoxy-manno-octulosonate cytidylyltransferase (CMP-KDO synthetase)
MNIIGIIPSRFGSTRFPGKPLIDIGGMSMVERVYRQAMTSDVFDLVVVATDDKRIFDAVTLFGGKAVMTDSSHPSGTDRCAEVMAGIGDGFDAVVNIQGDEPFIHPGQIRLLTEAIAEEGAQIATLVKRIGGEEELFNPNQPKVVVSATGEALYFSRQAIPYVKSAGPNSWSGSHVFFKHIGIYAYRTGVLAEITRLPQGKLELAESLEQLRWLEHGYRIRVRETPFETVAIDTPDDLGKALQFLRSQD